MAKMECKTMMILGGYGSAGICIARLLLQETGLKLILAGRSFDRAHNAAEDLNNNFTGKRVRGIQLDASNDEELKIAFTHCDAVMVCVPVTSSKIEGGVMQAAFDADIHYIDLNPDEKKQALAKRLGEHVRKADLFFMTEVGFMPGVPSALAFLAARQFDSLQTLEYGGLMKEKNSSYGSVIDLIVFAAEPAYVYHNGKWQKARKTASRKMDFGSDFGIKTCYPTDLHELRSLPDHLGFEKAGFYSAGVNPIADLILFFWVMTGLHRFSWSLRLGTKLAIWSIRKFTKPPFTTTVMLEASGIKDNCRKNYKISINHHDPYIATAITAVAGVLQLLDGTIGESGVMTMGHVVDPDRYFQDIKRLGMDIKIEKNHPGGSA
jgi:short subunit dehydrogenase-like uncharacterized protein